MKLLFKVTFYVSFKFLTLFVFFVFVRFSSRVRGSFIQHLSFGGLRDKVIFGSSLSDVLRVSWLELAGASVPWSDCHFLVRQCKPTSVLSLQRNASDCAWAVC